MAIAYYFIVSIIGTKNIYNLVAFSKGIELIDLWTLFLRCGISIRYHSRFFVQVGHETIYAAIGDHHFFIKTCHRQTHQNY